MISEALVLAETWERAKTGDSAAIEELQRELDGVVLYDHNFCPEWPPEREWVWVTTEELFAAGVIQAIRLHVKIPFD